MPYLAERSDCQTILSLQIQPRSSSIRFLGVHGSSLKLAITAPPVEGKANKQVITFLAKLLKLPKSALAIVSGETSRHKKLLIDGLSAHEVRKILSGHL